MSTLQVHFIEPDILSEIQDELSNLIDRRSQLKLQLKQIYQNDKLNILTNYANNYNLNYSELNSPFKKGNKFSNVKSFNIKDMRNQRELEIHNKSTDYNHLPEISKNNQNENFLNEVRKRIPMNRMALKNEYQGLLVFLLSNASSYVNGAVIAADGGRTAW